MCVCVSNKDGQTRLIEIINITVPILKRILFQIPMVVVIKLQPPKGAHHLFLDFYVRAYKYLLRKFFCRVYESAKPSPY